MKHTREQLDGMSGPELTNTLSDLVGYWQPFLNQWDAIMPLAVEHGVTLKSVACPAGSRSANYAESYCGLHHTGYIEPPQRAIACCLIMVLEGKL